jgi:hypothetical protein
MEEDLWLEILSQFGVLPTAYSFGDSSSEDVMNWRAQSIQMKSDKRVPNIGVGPIEDVFVSQLASALAVSISDKLGIHQTLSEMSQWGADPKRSICSWNYGASDSSASGMCNTTRIVWSWLFYHYLNNYMFDLEVFYYIVGTWLHENGGFHIVHETGGSKKSYAPYYGRDIVHTTHKAAYKIAGDLTGIDLVTEPDLISQPSVATLIAVDMGWYGWNSGLAIYTAMYGKGFVAGSDVSQSTFDEYGPLMQVYVKARRAINGTNKRLKVAKGALMITAVLHPMLKQLRSELDKLDYQSSAFTGYFGDDLLPSSIVSAPDIAFAVIRMKGRLSKLISNFEEKYSDYEKEAISHSVLYK